MRNQAGEKRTAAETQLALAHLSIEEGRAADAEIVARNCKQQFHQEGQADDELNASTVLIEALLAQTKQDLAQSELQSAQGLAAASQNRLLRLRFTMTSARVLLSADHPQSSRPLLEQVGREARQYGYVGIDLESQLLLAEVSRSSGHSLQAEGQLVAVENAARAKGFGLIAQKVKLTRKSGSTQAAVSPST